MAINDGLMSSLTDEWGTPQALFDELNAKYNFTLDACADATNHKVDNYYDKEMDGLSQKWEGTVWMNPPYGRDIKHWMKKAYESSLEGATVVCLVPSRTDTAWWHDYSMKGDITFFRGRLKFVGQAGQKLSSAPFPSALVVFTPPK